jgi:F1F0 ATPase subunit 2
MTAFVIILCFVAGLLGGAVYFGAMWRSVQRLAGEESTRSFFIGAFIRLSLLVLGFALLLWAGLGAIEVLAAMLGFLAARMIATRWAKQTIEEG